MQWNGPDIACDRRKPDRNHDWSNDTELRVIRVKRVYEPAGPRDGALFLVDRLWPRAIKKEQLHLAGWMKEVGPSPGLRSWFNHDPEKWEEFLRRYHGELDRTAEWWEPLIATARKRTVTLLFAARDPHYNNAVALKAYLDAKLHRRRRMSAARKRKKPSLRKAR